MSLKVITKEALDNLVTALQKDHRVAGPKPFHGQFMFGDVEEAGELQLDYKQTVLPPKKYLLPQREELVSFSTDGSRIEPVFDEQPTVLMGVHTCDLHAIKLLDKVMGHGLTDQHYQRRRESTVLVSVECLRPCTAHAFCKSMGTSSATDGFDLHLTDLSDAPDAPAQPEYAVEVGTPAGEALLAEYAETRPAGDDDYRRLNDVMAQKWPRFPYRLDFDVTELPALMRTSYDSPLWKELGERCLACGACTNVCPTCYCFNVQDEVDLTLSGGKRTRSWDSCQLDEFATVAGGHNFRKSRAERQRHRFLRKGMYQTDAHGLLGCVGCGRCAQACLVHITPVDTFNRLYHERAGSTPAATQTTKEGGQA